MRLRERDRNRFLDNGVHVLEVLGLEAILQNSNFWLPFIELLPCARVGTCKHDLTEFCDKAKQ